MTDRDYLHDGRVIMELNGRPLRISVWDTGRHDRRGQSYLGYSLKHGDEELFTGEDFAGSPLHADDSETTLAALLGFLTLRPGDIDAEHFESYTAHRLTWVERFGEEVSLIAHDMEARAERRVSEEDSAKNPDGNTRPVYTLSIEMPLEQPTPQGFAASLALHTRHQLEELIDEREIGSCTGGGPGMGAMDVSLTVSDIPVAIGGLSGLLSDLGIRHYRISHLSDEGDQLRVLQDTIGEDKSSE